jgi:cobalt-zinc-cadmium efflux system protein
VSHDHGATAPGGAPGATAGGAPHGHGHELSPGADRRWLGASLAVVVVFMIGEVIAGLLAHSLALITDSGHMLTDATAIVVAVIASRIAERPARGAYTYGFARVDALSGQASGITLVLLAVWFAAVAVRRLAHPGAVTGSVVMVVAAVGVAVNLVATYLAGRADRASLNVKGVVAHLATDAWAFAATFLAGLVVVTTGWTRADPIASLVVAALMSWTGVRLVRASGRVFLEAAPQGIDPDQLGGQIAAVEGMSELHDLHVWQIGPRSVAVSAHLLVQPSHDCHEVSARVRGVLNEVYGIRHVTLQTDHADAAAHDSEHCEDSHGQVHSAPPA